MATMFTSSIRPDCTIAANIQGWAGWFESVLTTIGGWTVTADTGQTAPASLPANSGQFVKVGYRIYKMNDDFTVDNPIYMRVDYGTGNPSGAPGMWISFGIGTDGLGNLTGLLWDGVPWSGAGKPTVSSNNHPSGAPFLYDSRAYASADHSRFVVGMFIVDFQNVAGYAGTDTWCLSVERSRDKDGHYTEDGILVTYSDVQLIGGGGTTQSFNASKYLICNRGGRTQPPLEKGLSFPYIRHSPAFSYRGSVPCAMASHFRGVAQQPGTNFTVVGVNDMALEGQMQVNYYGVNVIYQNLRWLVAARAIAGPLGSASALNDGGTRVCIRYD